MAWQEKFAASQEESLVDNCLFIVTRDFKLALDARYPIEADFPVTDPRHLLDFQERELGQIAGLQYPCLAIGPTRGTSGDGPNDECLRESVLIDFHIGVTDDSAANVTRRIMRYRATLDMVLRSASVVDYKRNMSVESFAFILDEIDYTYGPIGSDQSILFRGAVLQVPFKINER